MIDPQWVAIIGGALVGGVGIVTWGARLEGRIGSHDQLFTEREKWAEDRHNEVVRRLDRIERKIDANGNGKR